MLRSVSTHLELHLYGEADLISFVAVAQGLQASETLTIRSGAAGTAFLSQHGAAVDLRWMAVTAVADELPADDLTELVRLR